MGDRYRAPGGWSVEVVQLSATPDRRDGEWLRLCYCGYWAITDVRSIAELERWVCLADLERDTFNASCLNASRQGIPWQALLRLRPMRIDPASAEHPYRQLAAQLRERIERGEIAGQLPSITDLTAQTGLAVGTVRRGIGVLVKEGLVQTVPGRGIFVKR